MLTVLMHFAVGTVGALAVSLVLARLSGETGISAPFGAVFVGIACASIAHFLSPWATPAVLGIYALAGINEYVQDAKARKAAPSATTQPDGR